MSKTEKNGWIGVDLDGTLAHYDTWRGIEHIGAPIAPMVARVKEWVAKGERIKIFTARVDGGAVALEMGNPHGQAHRDRAAVRRHIKQWCIQHLGLVLPITNVKDYGMIELWDDRAKQVVFNEGVTPEEKRKQAVNTDMYVPGMWKCRTCGFTQHNNVICFGLKDGVLADASVETRSCPNEGDVLFPVTWQQLAEENQIFALKLLDENQQLKAQLEKSEAGKPQAPPDGSPIGTTDSDKYVPSMWKCPTCQLHARDYSLGELVGATTDTTPQFDPPVCPKDEVQMLHVTWKEWAEDNHNLSMRLLIEKQELEAKLQALTDAPHAASIAYLKSMVAGNEMILNGPNPIDNLRRRQLMEEVVRANAAAYWLEFEATDAAEGQKLPADQTPSPMRQKLDWPTGSFRVMDEPGEHDPCYLICPDGLMIGFNAHAINGTDQRRAQWFADTLNAALNADEKPPTASESPIHLFFNLSYANYLVLPRTLLQSCSTRTQQALCDALEMVYKEEGDNMPHHWPHEAEVEVKLRDCATKRYIEDDLADYERGRRRLWKVTPPQI